MKCPNCGAELNGNQKYCTECGAVTEHTDNHLTETTAVIHNGQGSGQQAAPKPLWEIPKLLRIAAFLGTLICLLLPLNTVTVILTLLCAAVFTIGRWQHCRSKEYAAENIDFFAAAMTYNVKSYDAAAFYAAKEASAWLGDGSRYVPKSMLIKRVLTVVIWTVLNYLTVNSLFYKKTVFKICVLLFLIMIVIFFSFNRYKPLVKEMKKHPKESTKTVIGEYLTEHAPIRHTKSAALLCVGIAALSFAALLTGNMQPQYTYAEAVDGVTISGYKPPLLNMTSVEIPKKHDGRNVVGIEKQVFSGMYRLVSAEIPQTVKRIDSGAFADCTALTDVVLPVGLTELGAEAFRNCASLTSVTIPEGVTVINGNTFEGCKSLVSVFLSDNIKEIHGHAFEGCRSLTEITLPAKITEINGYTFADCKSLREAVIPDGVTQIGGYAFSGCETLKSVRIPDSVNDIHGGAFSRCRALSEIRLPPDITEISGNTFEYCKSLSEIDIPDHVTRIGGHAFYNCSSLSRVTVPDSLREIGSSAFRLCPRLSEIVIPENASVNERAFKESPTTVRRRAVSKKYEFSDEQLEEIQKELESRSIEKIYVLYNKSLGTDVVYSSSPNKVICCDSDRIREKCSEGEDFFEITVPTEFKEYLIKARSEGYTDVICYRFSQKATDIQGETLFVDFDFDIDELIASYEEDPTRF